MSATVHAAAGSVALLLVAVFWLSTAVSELFFRDGLRLSGRLRSHSVRAAG